MPPVGTTPDAKPSLPQIPSAGDTNAKGEAYKLFNEANVAPIAPANVMPQPAPAFDEQPMPTPAESVTPKEEAIPADVMPAEPGAIKVPVAATPSPALVEAAPDPMTAFAPRPLETIIAPPAPATAPPSPAAPPNYPTPNWNAMENSTKAGAAPSSPHESTTPGGYDALSTSNLDRESATLEAQAGIEALRALSENPVATLTAAAEMARTGDETGLRALAPALKQVIERIKSK